MKNWKSYSLDELGDILNSKRIPLSSKQRSTRQGIYPYYGASGIFDYIDDYIFEGEHVLISEDGENLKTRQTPIAFKADGKFWVNNHAHIFKGKYDWVNDYIVYFFKNTDINPFITGAVQPKLNKGNLLRIPIKTPPNEIAQNIVKILSSLDDKTELNRKMNATLEEMACAVFKAWFVDFEPVHANANNQPSTSASPEIAKLFPSEFQESELGLIPKGWNIEIADKCFDIGIGKTPPRKQSQWFATERDENFRWVSIRNMGNGGIYILDTSEYLTSKAVKKLVVS